MPKKWYRSKMIWVNAIAAIATFVQGQYGFIISPEWQGFALTAVNVFLRVITQEEIEW